MAGQAMSLPTAEHLPKANRAVRLTGGQYPPVRRKDKMTAPPLELGALLAGRRVPEPDAAVEVSDGGQRLAVRKIGHGPGLALVPLEATHLLAGGPVQQVNALP